MQVVKSMASGFYLGETGPHYQWMDDGAGGSGYYSDGQGSGPFMLHLLLTIFYGSGPGGSGWYEDSVVITDFSGPMGASARHFSDGVMGRECIQTTGTFDSAGMSFEFGG